MNYPILAQILKSFQKISDYVAFLVQSKYFLTLKLIYSYF